MRSFDYVSATALPAVLDLLRAPDDGGMTRPLAGGTDLLTLMKSDIVQPDHLVDIKRLVELDDRIAVTTDGLSIGALATLAEIEDDPLVRDLCPALSQAASLAATPQLRNMATIGGNLLQRPRCWYYRSEHVQCWLKGGDDCPAHEGENQLHALFGGGPCYAVHPSDLATVLVAAQATIQIRSIDGERSVSLADFFTLPDEQRRTENILRDDELIAAVTIPPAPVGTRAVYLKAMERKVWAFALVGVAAIVTLNDDQVTAARMALGGVAPIPWRVTAAEAALQGGRLDAATIERAAAAALVEAQPLAKNGYKVPLAQALIRRALHGLNETPAISS